MFILNVFGNLFSLDTVKFTSLRVCPCLMGTFNENLILSVVWRSQKHSIIQVGRVFRRPLVQPLAQSRIRPSCSKLFSAGCKKPLRRKTATSLVPVFTAWLPYSAKEGVYCSFSLKSSWNLVCFDFSCILSLTTTLALPSQQLPQR